MVKSVTVRNSAFATDMSGSMRASGINGLLAEPDQRPSRAILVALAAVTVVFGLAYGPNFLDLQSVWNSDANYSHGYLIIPIAVFILWRRLSDNPLEPRSTADSSPWWGWFLLIAVLGVRAMAYEWSSQWVETATLLPVIACLTLTLGGWPLLSRAWPAIVFLIFLFPLPSGVNDSVALPLQRIAATGSCFLLQLSGQWVVQKGNVIHLTTPHGVEPLDVALACSGLRMLMTMAATITATIILIRLPTWKRMVLLVSTIPIAILSNMFRIVATGWCYYAFEGPKAKAWAHDVSGVLMMPLALAMVALELRLLSWLQTDQFDDATEKLLPIYTDRASGKKAKSNADLGELA